MNVKKSDHDLYYFYEIIKDINIGNKHLNKKKKTSFGVILYKKETDCISYLICQKRLTDQYISFIYGNYSKYKLFDLFCLMTENERNNLIKYDFDTLWNDVSFDIKGYNKAKIKFYNIRPHMMNLFDICKSQTEQTKWEFPKGRKNKKEDGLVCAKREFNEEIGVSIEHLTPSFPFTINEKFYGSDGNVYIYKYYLIEYDKEKFHANLTNRRLGEKCLNNEMKTFQWIQIPLVDFDSEFQKLYQIFNKKRTNIVYNIHISLQQEPIAISMKDLFVPDEEEHSVFKTKDDAKVIGNIIIV